MSHLKNWIVFLLVILGLKGTRGIKALEVYLWTTFSESWYQINQKTYTMVFFSRKELTFQQYILQKLFLIEDVFKWFDSKFPGNTLMRAFLIAVSVFLNLFIVIYCNYYYYYYQYYSFLYFPLIFIFFPFLLPFLSFHFFYEL